MQANQLTCRLAPGQNRVRVWTARFGQYQRLPWEEFSLGAASLGGVFAVSGFPSKVHELCAHARTKRKSILVPHDNPLEMRPQIGTAGDNCKGLSLRTLEDSTSLAKQLQDKASGQCFSGIACKRSPKRPIVSFGRATQKAPFSPQWIKVFGWTSEMRHLLPNPGQPF